jgi:hypothetical protein
MNEAEETYREFKAESEGKTVLDDKDLKFLA